MYVFYDYFCVICTGRRTFNSFRNGAKNSTIQIKAKYDDFQPVGEAAETLCGFVKNWLKREMKMLRQKLAYDCRSAKRFHVRRTALVALRMPRQQVVFITDF